MCRIYDEIKIDFDTICLMQVYSLTRVTTTNTQRKTTMATQVDTIMNMLAQKFGDGDGALNIEHDQLLSVLQSAVDKPTKRKGAKRERDPNKPKQPKSAFFLWSDTTRTDVRAELQEAADEGVKVKVGEVAKELSIRWKALSDEDKAPFEESSKEASASYAVEIAAYRKENGIATPSQKRSKFDGSVVPDTPEGWTGPVDGYLELVPVDPETGKKITKSFHDFGAAVAEAMRVGAGGITRSTQGYKLRKGTSISINDVSRSRSEVSWICDSPSVVSAPVSVSPVVNDSPQSPKADSPKAASPKADSPKAAPKAKKTLKRSTATPKKKAKSPTPPPPSPSPVVEEDDEVCEVEEFEHEGVTYLKDPASGELFADTEEEEEESAPVGQVHPDGRVEIF